MAPTPSGTNLWRWGTWSAGPPESLAHTDRQIGLLQFNMCGSKCNRGGLDVVDAMIRSIVRRPADVVLLNEVCLAQADALWTKLRNRGISMDGCFGASTGSSRCPGGEGKRWYGNAVFSAGAGIGAPRLIPLPNKPATNEQRNGTSMLTILKGRVVFLCSVHLSPRNSGDDCNRKQIAEVARILNARVEAGDAAILGGDFNTTPGHLRQIYEPGGRYREVDDPDNRRTYKNRKIDYIFLSGAHFEGISGKVTRSESSDHRPLRGEARFKSD